MRKKCSVQVMLRDLEITDLPEAHVPPIGADRARTLVKEAEARAGQCARKGDHITAARLYAAATLIALKSESVVYADIVRLLDATRDAIRTRSSSVAQSRPKRMLTRKEIMARVGYV